MSAVATTFRDDAAVTINLPFAFTVAGVNRATNGIFVGSNSYVTFGGPSSAYQNLGPSNPNVRTVFVGASWSRVLVQNMGGTPARHRVRFEGFNTWTNTGTPVVWEANFYSNQTMTVCIGGTNALTSAGGVTGVSSGNGRWLAPTWTTLQTSSLYVINNLRAV